MKYLIFLLPIITLGQAPYYIATNDSSTGTWLYYTAKINTSGNALVAASSSDIVEGIVIGGAGTTGKSTICIQGNCGCVFDNTPVTSDYVTVGTAGRCHSSGGSIPLSGQIIGRVSAHYPVPTGATANVDMTLKQTTVASGGSGSVNYGTNIVACSSSPSFNLNNSLYSVQQITVSCAVSNISFSNLISGAIITFRICRDSNNRSWPAWPGTVHGGFVNQFPQASKCDAQTFYSPDGINLWSNGLGVINQ